MSLLLINIYGSSMEKHSFFITSMKNTCQQFLLERLECYKDTQIKLTTLQN